jgi:hypothetical protein
MAGHLEAGNAFCCHLTTEQLPGIDLLLCASEETMHGLDLLI